MWDDPVIAEVHQTREQLAAEFAFDVGAIFADIRKRQTTLGSRLVSQPKRVEPAEAVIYETPANGSTSANPRSLSFEGGS
jgi:hypothetical protein